MTHSRVSFIRHLRSILAACLPLVFAATGLFAREARAIYLAGSGGPVAKAWLVGKDAKVEVVLPQRNLSPGIKLPQGDLLLAALPSVPAEGEELPGGAPRVSIPASWERCILIFLGDPTNKVFPMKVIPVNASATEFPKGSTLVYNFSHTTLVGQFGKERIHLESGKSKPFGAPIQGFGSYPMGIDCIPKGETAPRAICRSVWQHDPEARQILFVIPQEGRKIPRVWGVLDKSATP